MDKGEDTGDGWWTKAGNGLLVPGACSTPVRCTVVLVCGSLWQVLSWQTTSHVASPVALTAGFKILIADGVVTASSGETGLHCWSRLPAEQVTAPCTEMRSVTSALGDLLPLVLCCLGPMFIRSLKDVAS